MSFRTALLVGLLSLVVPATAAAQWDSATAALLAHSDTAAALIRLRQHAQATDMPEAWCALARLLTATATMHQSTWRVRYEAYEAFARGLRGGDVQCLYGYVLLKEKQGTRADAMRMLNRVEKRLASDSGAATTAFRAELLYRRALLLDDWLRNFDFPGPDAASTAGRHSELYRVRRLLLRELRPPALLQRAVPALAEAGLGD